MGLYSISDSLLPSTEEVQFYRAHGWYRSRRVLPDELLDRAYEGIQRHFAGDRDCILPSTSGFSDWKPEDGAVLRNAEVVALQNRDVRELAFYPLLGAIAARLTGSRQVRYFADTVVDKPGNLKENESIVGWHTDLAYWRTCSSESLLTIWIPFQDCTDNMGPLLYLDGSHLWVGTDHLRTFRSKDLGELESRFPEHRPFKKVSMTLKRGEISIHHCRLIHGSGLNVSGRGRLALAVHLQDEVNRYRVYRNESGIPWHIFLDDLAAKRSDGTPDYSDPATFPVIWPSSTSAV